MKGLRKNKTCKVCGEHNVAHFMGTVGRGHRLSARHLYFVERHAEIREWHDWLANQKPSEASPEKK